jgi:glycosyltransferase involved in cell wall biosynthesis
LNTQNVIENKFVPDKHGQRANQLYRSRINVLLAIDKAGYDGKMHGGGRFFFNILSRINQERFKVIPCILRREDSLKSLFEKEGIRVRYLGRGKFDPLVLFDFLKLIRKEKIHIMHLNSFGSQLFGRLSGAITGVPTIIHGHGIDYCPTWYQKTSDLFLSKFTDRAITVSTSVKADYIKRRKIDPKKVLVIPNGIPLEDFETIPEQKCREIKKHFRIKSDYYVVGTVTRLREEKGNRYFLEAAAEVLKVSPMTYFLLVGDGPLLDELRLLAKQLGISRNVIFAGHQHDVASLLSIFDVKVISSVTEGHPLAILEAMATRKPIVATNVGGIKDILNNGEIGLLIPPREPHAMADKIIYLLQHKKEREQLAMKAYQESRKYSLDVYIRHLERVYEEIDEKIQ